MKKMTFRALTGMLMIIAAGVLFSSCNKNDDSDQPDLAVAGLMGFNMAPDQYAIGITLDGSSISNVPIGYDSYTGMYVAVFAGNRQLRTYGMSNSNLLAENSVVFDTSKYYSVFFMGANGNYRHVIAEDKFDELSGANGKAYVRFIQSIPDSTDSRVVISGNGTNWVDQDAGFGDISEFVAVDPGEIAISVNNSADVALSRTITVEAKKIYTVLIMGHPDSQLPEAEGSIRFISNGSLP